MIFGRTYQDQHKELQNKLAREAQWAPWFAWFPVQYGYIGPSGGWGDDGYRGGDGQRVWLQVIWRRARHYKEYGHWTERSGWHYILALPVPPKNDSKG